MANKQTMARILPLIAVLTAFALRIYALDAKGLSYDEAATALMARATPGEIIAFHWHAAFEHPPVWQLLMHGWSLLAGQSEFALRYLPTLTGVLLLPLLYQLALPRSPLTINRSALTILPLLAPILIYYSQEARMYALVVTTAVAATSALLRLLTKPATQHSPALIATFILLHWFMLGLHYYSALLVAAEGLFCLIWLLVNRAPRRQWITIIATMTAAVAPLLLWLALAPGFHDTLRMLLADPTPKPTAIQFLQAFWRELTFAAVRWDVEMSTWGYLWLPLALLGVVALLLNNQRGQRLNLLACYPLFATLIPIGISAFFFPSLATRYLLFVVPFLLLIMAAGLAWLSRLHWTVAIAGLLTALVVPALALPHYFGPYQKSAYREMTQHLIATRRPQEALLLEAPRQHLLAKYYLPGDLPIYSAPAINLPAYWPVNAPPVVPEAMDDLLQQLLRAYTGIWLSLTAENEVDPGEFVPKYLTAVAFEADCDGWRDVRLCHYLSPAAFPPNLTTRTDTVFTGNFELSKADLAVETATAASYLLTTLHWQATATPPLDYRVTLRLLDQQGTAVAQRDSFPIGPLLPPTTWQTGDEKPGYMALPLPPDLPHGTYQLTVNLYNPADGSPIAHTTAAGNADSTPVGIATVVVGDSVEVIEWK